MNALASSSQMAGTVSAHEMTSSENVESADCMYRDTDVLMPSSRRAMGSSSGYAILPPSGARGPPDARTTKLSLLPRSAGAPADPRANGRSSILNSENSRCLRNAHVCGGLKKGG